MRRPTLSRPAPSVPAPRPERGGHLANQLIDQTVTSFIAQRIPSGIMVQDEHSRFGKLWAAWDARIAAGDPPRDILQEAKDEELIEILAGESRLDRKYARDIIATEILNRMHTRSSTQHPGARSVEKSAQAAQKVAQDSQEAIHHAEGILKASGAPGSFDLGAAVSASADASLLATKAAFDSAKVQAEALHETLTQSRLGAELAAEAAQVADEGREVTRELEQTMRSLGRAEEGRAASDAAREIKKATDQAAENSAEHDAEMRSE